MSHRAIHQMLRASLLGATILGSTGCVMAAAPPTVIAGNDGTLPLPNGQYITPQAIPGETQQFLNPGLAPYPNFIAGEAVRAQVSPDGNTMAVLTAGQNSLVLPTGVTDTASSTQFIFIYDISSANEANPKLLQVLQQTNAHVGLVWGDNNTLYAAGGNDDAVYVYTRSGGMFAQAAKIALGHNGAGIGLKVQPNASGLAVSADGKTLVVANNYNDSISVIDTATRTVRYEHDLRPFAAGNEGTAGAPGGTYPLAVAIKGNGTAYVGSFRDRQVVVVDISGATSARVTGRIPLDGNPNGMTLDATQQTLYVAQDNADEVAVINTATNAVMTEIDARAPSGMLTGPHYTGAAPFSVRISPDEQTLYAVDDGSNAVAVIPLAGAGALSVAGLLPTAFAPKDIAFSADGTRMYIINGKSDTGANPQHLTSQTSLLTNTTYPGGNKAAAAASGASNQYQFQLEHASLVSAPVPDTAQLATLTTQVAQNNFYNTAGLSTADQATMDFLHAHIKHVIYIVKENRTFDQVLGDLTNGANADGALAVFGRQITPNFHRIATDFVTLDNFFDAADGSMDGWSLATRGRTTTTEEITQQINYAFVNRGLSYESEGNNRNVPMGVATEAARDNATVGAYSALAAAEPGGAANVLVGTNNVSSTDAPYGIQQGFIYDAVLQAGGTVRNYGFLVDNIGSIGTKTAPIVHPFTSGVTEVASVDPTLQAGLTDLYYRGFDQNYPDLWRVYEWEREFAGYVSGGNLPSLETVRVSHDHMGSFSTALAGVNTPETEQADDDLAVGRLVSDVANSPFAASTLIIVTEDDPQDGPDHVDSHRTTTYLVGAYVKQHALISTRYNQVSVLRTIEDILGTSHLNLNTAYQRPMVEAFDTSLNPNWTYTPVASTVLKTTTVMQAARETGVRYASGPDVKPRHDAAYWARATKGFDFSHADRVPDGLYNQVLWKGLMNGQPYPAHAVPHATAAKATDND